MNEKKNRAVPVIAIVLCLILTAASCVMLFMNQNDIQKRTEQEPELTQVRTDYETAVKDNDAAKRRHNELYGTGELVSSPEDPEQGSAEEPVVETDSDTQGDTNPQPTKEPAAS